MARTCPVSSNWAITVPSATRVARWRSVITRVIAAPRPSGSPPSRWRTRVRRRGLSWRPAPRFFAASRSAISAWRARSTRSTSAPRSRDHLRGRLAVERARGELDQPLRPGGGAADRPFCASVAWPRSCSSRTARRCSAGPHPDLAGGASAAALGSLRAARLLLGLAGAAAHRQRPPLALRGHLLPRSAARRRRTRSRRPPGRPRVGRVRHPQDPVTTEGEHLGAGAPGAGRVFSVRGGRVRRCRVRIRRWPGSPS